MKRIFSYRIVVIFSLLTIVCALTACNLPSQVPTPAATQALAATQPILPTVTTDPTLIISATPTLTLSPTLTLTPSLTSTPTLTSTSAVPSKTPVTPTVPPKTAYKGLFAYNRTQQIWTGYDFTGAPLNLTIAVPNLEWIGYNTAQYANNSAYYLKATDKTIVQIAANGAAQKLAFIPAKDSLHFLISQDGKKIAWSFITQSTGNPGSELWLANIDGTGIKKIAQVEPATNTKWLTFEPYRWLPDGRLLYIDEPTGIGGYILFYGFAGIHVYDPATGVSNHLTPTIGSGNLCLKEISKDLKVVISTCTTSDRSTIAYINTATNQTLTITRLADQNQAGSALYSPGGEWLAYAFAKGDGDNEAGKVAVAPANGTTPKILATVQKGYFNVVAWISDLQFIVQRHDSELTSLWLVSRDTGSSIKLAEGTFVGLIPK